MAILPDLTRSLKAIAVPFIGICVCGYFAYHLIQGERGVIRLWQLKQEITQAEKTRREVNAVRDLMEHRAALLRPNSLDMDMIEERARFMLGLGRAEEMVILLPD